MDQAALVAELGKFLRTTSSASLSRMPKATRNKGDPASVGSPGDHGRRRHDGDGPTCTSTSAS
jgi:hypothetical protein